MYVDVLNIYRYYSECTQYHYYYQFLHIRVAFWIHANSFNYHVLHNENYAPHFSRALFVYMAKYQNDIFTGVL